MFNLFINKAINENLQTALTKEVRTYRKMGGNWTKKIVVDGNQYYLTKSEINLIDEEDDYTIDCINEDENKTDYIVLKVKE